MQEQTKWRFILVYGILLWGYPVGLLTRSIDLFEPAIQLPRFASAAEVAIFLAIWTVAGVVFGGWMWHAQKSATEQHEEAQTSA